MYACNCTNKARRGAYAKSAGRAAAALLLRGRVVGELCRHSLAGSRCAQADCPFVHRALHGTNSVAPAPDADVAVCGAAILAAALPAAAPEAAAPRVFGDITQYRRVGERPSAGRLMVPARSLQPLSSP